MQRHRDRLLLARTLSEVGAEAYWPLVDAYSLDMLAAFVKAYPGTEGVSILGNDGDAAMRFFTTPDLGGRAAVDAWLRLRPEFGPVTAPETLDTFRWMLRHAAVDPATIEKTHVTILADLKARYWPSVIALPMVRVVLLVGGSYTWTMLAGAGITLLLTGMVLIRYLVALLAQSATRLFSWTKPKRRLAEG
jgi:hypothetical protein